MIISININYAYGYNIDAKFQYSILQDTVPNATVEINGKLKVNNIPIGVGGVLYSDENGIIVMNKSNIAPFSETDSLTMKVTSGPGIPLSNGTYNIKCIDMPYVNNDPSFYINLVKRKDTNSIGFANLVLTQPAIISNLILEINIYKQGEITPYYSMKFSDFINAYVYQEEYTSGEDANLEKIGLNCTKIGLKDWVSGYSYAFNKVNNTFGSY